MGAGIIFPSESLENLSSRIEFTVHVRVGSKFHVSYATSNFTSTRHQTP